MHRTRTRSPLLSRFSTFGLSGSTIAAALACTAVWLTPGDARAQRTVLTRMGNRGTLAIDQLSGFRVSAISSEVSGSGTVGVTYAGPIGFSVTSVGQKVINDSTNVVFHQTNVWLAPSADYFVIDHLSVGGLVEIISTSSSFDTTTGNGTTVTRSLPGTTSFTILPRVGWLFGITDHFGIWPRAGIGYASVQSVNPNDADTKNTFSTLLFDIDVGFVYRVNENFFLRAAPEMAFGLGPSHSVSRNGGSVSTDASLFHFSGVAGLGVMWDL